MYAQITITSCKYMGVSGPLRVQWGFYDYYSDWLEFIIIGFSILGILLDVPNQSIIIILTVLNLTHLPQCYLPNLTGEYILSIVIIYIYLDSFNSTSFIYYGIGFIWIYMYSDLYGFKFMEKVSNDSLKINTSWFYEALYLN